MRRTWPLSGAEIARKLGLSRSIQTLLREWAYGLSHRSSDARNAGLRRWLARFNCARPHSAIQGLPPLSAVDNLMRKHT